MPDRPLITCHLVNFDWGWPAFERQRVWFGSRAAPFDPRSCPNSRKTTTTTHDHGQRRVKTEDGLAPAGRRVETGYWSVTPAPERDPGVRKVPFTVVSEGEDVPALLWLPEPGSPVALSGVRYYVRPGPFARRYVMG